MGATCDSEHACAIHMIGKVSAWLERASYPALALPTVVVSLSRPTGDAAGVATLAMGGRLCGGWVECEAGALLRDG